METTRKRRWWQFGFAIHLIAVVVLASSAAAGERRPSPARLEYLGIREGESKKTGERITVAVFRLKNLTSKTLTYPTLDGEAYFDIAKKTNASWEIVQSVWKCHFGRAIKSAKLEPEQSKLLYIDPGRYAAAYGPQLKFAIWAHDEDSPLPFCIRYGLVEFLMPK